jgi:hypothetical protein
MANGKQTVQFSLSNNKQFYRCNGKIEQHGQCLHSRTFTCPVQRSSLFLKMWLTACSACFDNMTFLVASMTYCFLKFAVLRIVSLAIATIELFMRPTRSITPTKFHLFTLIGGETYSLLRDLTFPDKPSTKNGQCLHSRTTLMG